MSGELTITAFCPNELFTCSSHLRQQPQSASRNITGFAACAVPMMAEKAATANTARRTGVIEHTFGSWALQPIGRFHESQFQPYGRAPLLPMVRARGFAGAGEGSGAG